MTDVVVSTDPRRPALGSALALTTASQVAATSSVLALTTIPTLVAATLGVEPHAIGFQVSLIYASGVLFSMMASTMVKRWGAGRVGQLALLGAGVGFIGLATGTALGIALASILIGVGYALNNPSSSHILARLAPPERRNLIFSVKQAGVPLGGMLAALAVPPLAEALGWQKAMLIFAIAPLALALFYEQVRPSWDGDRVPEMRIGRGMWRGQRTVLADPDLRALAVLGFLYSGVQLSISTFTVAMLIEQFGWNPLSAAAVAAAVQAAGAVGRVVWGLIADRLENGFAVLGVIGLVTGAATLTFALIGSWPVLGVGLIVLSGFTGNGWNGVLLAETAKASPRGGTLTGEVLTHTFIGVMVGPAVFSLAYVVMGSFAATFRLFAILAFLGAVLAFWRSLRTRLDGVSASVR